MTDCFAHEQSLVLECGDGIVILNSCSHGGADNIIREVSAEYPGRRVLQIYTGHCTGDNGYRILSRELGGTVHQLCVGLEMEF